MPDPQTPPPDAPDGGMLPETEVDSSAPAQPDSQAIPANASAAPTLRQPHAASTPQRPGGSSPVGDDWLIGQTVDHYFIEEKIGEGGFGAVYRARDIRNRRLARHVVIKFLKDAGIDNDWVVGKFKQEVEALARLDNHPGIVGLLDAGEFQGLPYIVLQYVNGVPLRKRIKPGGMDLEEVAEVVRQTASALAEAHSQGILHRDLKPENIMLRKLGSGEINVVVIDFGVAKLYNSYLSLSSETGSVAGTYPYMSPEQLRGHNKSMTPASEVYSLGVIVYEMLTGILPFNARDVDVLREMQEAGIKVKPQDLHPDLPEAAENVLLRALSFDQTRRFQNIKTFGDELARTLLKPDPVSPRVLRNKKWLAPAAVALVLALATVAGLFILPPGKEQPQALAYSLTVQKVFDGRPAGGPEEYTGTELFGNGWKFKFNLTPVEEGHFYLLNAAPQPDGSTEWNVLFPTPQNNAGQSKINGQQKQTFGWYVFDDKPGQEKLWLVWSLQPVPDLETAVKAATRTALVIKEPELAAVTNFLQPWEKRPPTAFADEAQKRTVILSDQPTWAYLAKLRHDKY
jgi:serine/threonine protein kinase